MPKIIISEKDLTQPDRLEENDNIVFVPGYSLMGPVNEPILCRNLSDFKSIFGNVPYKFVSDQTLSGTTFLALAGEYEKSYIYASELLNQGLPILFYRFGGSTGILKANNTSDKFEKKIEISAKYYGEYGNSISCEFNRLGNLYNYTKANPQPTADTFDKGVYYTLQDGGLYIKANAFETDVTYYTRSLNESVEYSLVESIAQNTNLGIVASSNTISRISFIDTTSPYYYKNITTKFVDINVLTESGTPDETTSDITIKLENGKDSFVLDSFYGIVDTSSTTLDILEDKNEYDIKCLTFGSYPTLFVSNTQDGSLINKGMTKLKTIASTRGDCKALIDVDNVEITSDWAKNISSDTILFDTNDTSKYCTSIIPWGTYNIPNLDIVSVLPGSFAYLECLAKSLKTNADWYAIAGVNRGYVPNLIQLSYNVSGAIADALQSKDGVSVNSILNVKPYGYCIWGNRTLNKNDGLTASSFLNIRTMTDDIKKLVYRVAKKLTFEQDSNILWLNFKAAIEPTLDKMVSDNGLADYKIIKLTTTKRATIACKIRLVAIEAVEDWDITIELADSYTTVE